MSTLQAAFGAIDITPEIGPRFGRFGINILTSTGVKWPLTARLALFDDGSARLAVCVLDLNVIFPPVAAEFRAAIATAAGLPPAHVMVATTHTHCAPATNPWLPVDDAYAGVDRILPLLGDLARRTAVALAPATLRFAHGDAPGWSFNRRPIYRDADGREQVGTHGRRDAPGFVRMEGPDERDVWALLAVAADSRPMGGIVNFGCHPTAMYSDTRFSADYPGPLRDRLEQQLGGTFVFANGPAGDLSQNSGIPGRTGEGGAEYARRMGEGIADRTIVALRDATAIRASPLLVRREILRIAQRRVTGTQVETARRHLESRARGEPSSGRLARDLYGYAYHFHHNSEAVDDWLARDIVGTWEHQRRVGARELVEDVEIQALACGDLAIVGFPCEYFSTLGHAVRAASPFPATQLVELANGWQGYIPEEDGIARGGYESCLALQSRLAPDAGKRMGEAAVRLLRELRANA
jgi:neutral ceramidase